MGPTIYGPGYKTGEMMQTTPTLYDFELRMSVLWMEGNACHAWANYTKMVRLPFCPHVGCAVGWDDTVKRVHFEAGEPVVILFVGDDEVSSSPAFDRACDERNASGWSALPN